MTKCYGFSLCFVFSKYQERYLVERRGKFNVGEELSRLPFNVPRTSKYICKGCLQLLKKRHGLANQLRDVDCKLKYAFGLVESDQPEESLTGCKRPSVDTGELFVQTPKKYRFEQNPNPLTSSPIAIRRVCAAERFNLFSLHNARSLKFAKRQ